MFCWSDNSLSIIDQIALANEGEDGGSIVVLVDMNKVEMEQQLMHAMESNECPLILLGTTVVFRNGNPIMEHQLSKVCVTPVRTIISLSPMDMEPIEANSTMVQQVEEEEELHALNNLDEWLPIELIYGGTQSNKTLGQGKNQQFQRVLIS
eukprot:9807690-Ditylum_brightwellii.AAC.1